jgi:hypothetical protein
MKGFEADTLGDLEKLLSKTVYRPWVKDVFVEIRKAVGESP